MYLHLVSSTLDQIIRVSVSVVFTFCTGGIGHVCFECDLGFAREKSCLTNEGGYHDGRLIHPIQHMMVHVSTGKIAFLVSGLLFYSPTKSLLHSGDAM